MISFNFKSNIKLKKHVIAMSSGYQTDFSIETFPSTLTSEDFLFV